MALSFERAVHVSGGAIGASSGVPDIVLVGRERFLRCHARGGSLFRSTRHHQRRHWSSPRRRP
jgi:hypothetical protein